MKLYQDYFWLRKKYWTESLGGQEIAEICGVYRSTIYRRMEKFGISRRTSSEAKQGKMNPNFGKKRDKKICKKISETRIKIGIAPWNKGKTGVYSEETKRKMRAWQIGRKFTEEHKRKLSENHRDMHGENNHNWKGGISFEPYPPEFNDKLRKKIRERDENACQFCGSNGNGEKVQAHHIDYDRKISDELNLISLCRSCNNRANHNESKWQFLFEVIQELRFTRA